MPLHPNVVSYYARAGYKLELVVIDALEEMLAILGVEARIGRISSGAPYDVELLVNGKRAFIEVKGSTREDRLQWKVSQAFRREHPEPFCVIGVLNYPRSSRKLLNSNRAWLWFSPTERGKLSPANLRKWLKRSRLL